MVDISPDSVEKEIRTVLNCLWAMTGKVDPEKFAIGIDYESWWSLVKNSTAPKTTVETTMVVGDETFFVIPLGDMPAGTVALVWRKLE